MNLYILRKILEIPAILIAFTFHEYAHAVVADRLGDKTPRFQGRLSLNPLVHIDIIGFIMILIVGFGWAKPTEVNPGAFKNYYKDDLKVSLAGPIANLLVAIVFGIGYSIVSKFFGTSDVSLYIQLLLYVVVDINCMLFIFNLLPIPGLDGFHVLRDIFPKFFYNISDSLYRYQLIILVVLVFPIYRGYSLISIVLSGPVDALTRLLTSF